MKFKVTMAYLGAEPKTSKKGTSYFMVKFMEMATSSIYEFYVPADRVEVVGALAGVTQFEQVSCVMSLSSFNGKAEVMLDKLEKK